jgi:plastocyanin
MKALLILCAAGAALGVPGNDSPDANAPKSGEEFGAIAGTVMWEGDRPEPKPPLAINETETKGCTHEGGGMATDDRSLLISDAGGVANVVLQIEAKGVELEVPSDPVILDQKGCRFEPRVVVVPVGATLRFLNSDETNHNIHTFAKKNQAMNKNVAGGSNLDQKLDKAEVINVKCDVHTWMKSFVVVSDATHSAISGADGSFKIEGLPAGDYKIDWWHEELGKGKSEMITVKAGETTSYDHKVGAAKKKSGGGRRRR